jgi:hypothetical protein
VCRRWNNTERIIRSVHREPCRPQGKAPFPEVWYSLVKARKQTATVVTHRQPTQQHRFWRDAGGSVGVLRAWHAWREASRTWETLEVPAPQGSREGAPTTRRTAEDLQGVRSAHRTARQASRSPKEGADGVMEPAQETWSGQEGLEQTMPTSLQGRAKQAAHDKSYRLRTLFGMLTVA